MPPGLQPAHKMSIVLFLERVYGIPDQETFFRLIEEAFIPDMRSATMLDQVILLFFLFLIFKSKLNRLL
jgi:ryanodine receptor 2